MRHLITKIVLEEDNARLLAPPSKDEWKVVAKSIPVDSSPRLDGFGLDFFLTCWEFIKVDLLDVVKEFCKGVPLSRFFSTSFIMLIPKVENPTSYDKFWPISLCIVAYKIFSKSLLAGYRDVYTVLFLLNNGTLSLSITSLKASL